jgi:hypothetical protein
MAGVTSVSQSAELNLEVIIAPRGKDDPVCQRLGLRASIPRPAT